jgi:hypothetical protein
VTITSPNPGNHAIDTTQPFFLASSVGGTVSPVFQGGTLRMDQPNATYAQNFTLNNSATNTIDQFGNASTFTGVFSDTVPGTPGNIVIANSGLGGSVTFNGANTYTGTTTINSGAELIIGPTGSINNPSTITNSGVLLVEGAVNVGGITNTGSGLIVNTGAVTDDLNNFGVIFNSGSWTAPVVNNAGVFNQIGSLAGTIGTFNNSGTLSMVNGATTDIFAVTTFNGLGGRLAIDVNPTSTATTPRADLLKTTNLSGATVIVINPVGPAGLISKPIPVIEAQNVAPGTSVIAAPTASIVNYNVQQSGGTYNLTSTINTSVVAATPTGIDAVLSAMNTGFFQNSSAYVSEPPEPGKNQWNGGPWIRVADGQNDVTSDTSTQNPTANISAPAKVRARFNGFQTGIDLGVANVEGTGWNTHLGVTAGEVNIFTNDLLGSSVNSQANVPYLGIYGAVTGHNFFADFLVREDFYNVSLNNPVAFLNSAPVIGKAVAANASAGYRVNLTSSWFIEPSAAFMYSDLHIDSLRIDVDPTGKTAGYLVFNPFQSALGRVGVRVGTTYVLDNFQLALQPFATGSIWREFDGPTHSTFVLGQTAVPLSVTRLGTFAQFGAGVSGQVLNSGFLGFLRGDYRVGENISGYALVAGMRYQF